MKLRGLAAIDMRTVAAREMVALRDELISALGGGTEPSPQRRKLVDFPSRGRTYLPFEPGYRYIAFCDPAGGSGGDSMTLGIARSQEHKAVLCRVAEWKPPFSPAGAAAEVAAILKEYGLARVRRGRRSPGPSPS